MKLLVLVVFAGVETSLTVDCFDLDAERERCCAFDVPDVVELGASPIGADVDERPFPGAC